jgi:hypothetical protein
MVGLLDVLLLKGEVYRHLLRNKRREGWDVCWETLQLAVVVVGVDAGPFPPPSPPLIQRCFLTEPILHSRAMCWRPAKDGRRGLTAVRPNLRFLLDRSVFSSFSLPDVC